VAAHFGRVHSEERKCVSAHSAAAVNVLGFDKCSTVTMLVELLCILNAMGSRLKRVLYITGLTL
jgi:hypothetical protein